MKSHLALSIVLLTLAVPAAQSNDFDKLMNKALGSNAKNRVLKQAESLAKSKLLKPATPGAAAVTAAPSAAVTATPSAAANPTATGSAAAAAGTPAAAAATGAKPLTLKDKLKHRAAVEGEKNLKKYSDKYLKNNLSGVLK